MLQSGGNITTTSSAAAAEQSAADMAAAEAAEEAGERGFGGNRWPRQETVALLKIRSEMDVAFRDATVKGPLWEEVSRKLGELGYQRSAKKCKEKFENVYKYHKRTKEGRTGKTDGKTYRFFDQLQALETSSPNTLITFSQPPPSSAAAVTVPSTIVTPISNNAVAVNVPPLNVPPTSMSAMMNAISSSNYFSGNMNMNMNTNSMNMNVNMMSGELFHSESPSSSSSTSSDVEIGGGGNRGGGRGRKRKRKWKEFFERLTKQVVEKQEELQRRFLETVEKREHERMVREESWRTQEMARINRERELLAQERSTAAAKDAAVMAFLQKLSENNTIPTAAAASVPRRPHITTPPPPHQRSIPIGSMDSVPPPGLNPTVPPPPHQPSPQPPQSAPAAAETPNASKTDNGDRNVMTPPLASSSRWPKVEIEALIMLRTNLDSKYQENGPKGPLWEEISAGMRRYGYNRNAKRCKEKWENINKYFKKVKESNKKRPEDSKTCPYFHQLEALYRQKSNRFVNFQDTTSSSGQIKPENSVPLMVQPEQQWPPPPETNNNPRSEGHFGQNLDDDDDVDEDDRDGDDDDEDEDDDDGGEFEIVPNNNNNNK